MHRTAEMFLKLFHFIQKQLNENSDLTTWQMFIPIVGRKKNIDLSELNNEVRDQNFSNLDSKFYS
jgi:hypothetical protein